MLGWGNCNLIVPEMLYWQYGSDEALKTQYESMKKFVDCEIRHMSRLPSRRGLWISPNLGDWLMMGKDMKYMGMHHGPVSNSFIVNDLRILSETAVHFGKLEDAERYGCQLEKSRNAYLKAYVRKDGTMKDDYQGAYIMALRYVIPQGALWDRVFQKLVGKLRQEGMQTGFFATEHLLPLLAENGQERLAYDLLLSESCPGWLYQVNCGATTTWERWDALRPDGTVNESKMANENMVSFNHYAFGSVGEFYYRHILGIRPLEKGYRKILIAPVVDARLGSVEGSYQSRAGLIRSVWSIKDGLCRLAIEVPSPSVIRLPNGEEHEVVAGSYEYEVKIPKSV